MKPEYYKKLKHIEQLDDATYIAMKRQMGDPSEPSKDEDAGQLDNELDEQENRPGLESWEGSQDNAILAICQDVPLPLNSKKTTKSSATSGSSKRKCSICIYPGGNTCHIPPANDSASLCRQHFPHL
jgi:hypothetical protein